MIRAALVWVAGLAVVMNTLHFTWQEVQRASVCDTTYIYEGYAPVDLPAALKAAFPRYKVVTYEDRAPSLQQGIATLKARRTVPLLFVHGHLGSPQQMRSMASEASREAIKRLESSKGWDFWLQWHAIDFNAEPSAFEPHLMEEQANFVAACVRLLASSQPSQVPTAVVLVGYSMGGLVMESALRRLALPGSNFDLRNVPLVLTLGAPRHLPSFLRPQRGPAESQFHSTQPLPPTVHVLAGPGDLMIPALSSWAAFRRWRPGVGSPGLVAPIQVDMDDVPGVWCTATHKNLVSCNQLVRQTVPTILNAAAAHAATSFSRGEDDPGARAWAAAWQLTTAAALALPSTAAEALSTLERHSTAFSSFRSGNRQPAEPTASADCAPASQEGTLFTHVMSEEERQGLCASWSATERGIASGSFFLVLAGLAPEEHFRVWAGMEDGSSPLVDLSPLARPLPGLLKDFQSVAPFKRPWYENMAGVDWLRNSTRLLHVPFGTGPRFFQRIQLEVEAQPNSLRKSQDKAGAAGVIMAQLLSSSDGLPFSSLPPSFVSVKAPSWPFEPPVTVPQGHTMVLELKIPGWMPGDGVTAAAAAAPLALLLQLLVGPALPWRATVQRQQCWMKGSEDDVPEHEAVLVAMDRTAEHAAGAEISGLGDTVKSGAQGVSLWHPAVANRCVVLVSDPRCSYAVRLNWDVGAWLTYTLRYHAYALIPVALALSMRRSVNEDLSPAYRALSLALPAFALPAASIWPWLALSSQLPWLPLSSAEVVVIGSAAGSVLGVLSWVLAAIAALIRSIQSWKPTKVVAASWKRWKNAPMAATAITVLLLLLSTAAHPAMPPLAALPLLLWRIASSSSSVSIQRREESWTLIHALCAMPAALWLYGWAASGRTHPCPLLTMDRALMLAAGAHACFFAAGERKDSGGTNSTALRRTSASVCIVAAALAGLRGLAGDLHVSLHAAAGLCVWDLVGVKIMRKLLFK